MIKNLTKKQIKKLAKPACVEASVITELGMSGKLPKPQAAIVLAYIVSMVEIMINDLMYEKTKG